MVNLRDRRRQEAPAPEGASYNDRGVLVFHDPKAFSRYLRSDESSKYPLVLGEERPSWDRRLLGPGVSGGPGGRTIPISPIYRAFNIGGEAGALTFAGLGGGLKWLGKQAISPLKKWSFKGADLGDWEARKQLQPGTRESTWDKWSPSAVTGELLFGGADPESTQAFKDFYSAATGDPRLERQPFGRESVPVSAGESLRRVAEAHEARPFMQQLISGAGDPAFASIGSLVRGARALPLAIGATRGAVRAAPSAIRQAPRMFTRPVTREYEAGLDATDYGKQLSLLTPKGGPTWKTEVGQSPFERGVRAIGGTAKKRITDLYEKYPPDSRVGKIVSDKQAKETRISQASGLVPEEIAKGIEEDVTGMRVLDEPGRVAQVTERADDVPVEWKDTKAELEELRRIDAEGNLDLMGRPVARPSLEGLREQELGASARVNAQTAAGEAYERAKPTQGEPTGFWAGNVFREITDEDALVAARMASNDVFRQFQRTTGIDVESLIHTIPKELEELWQRPIIRGADIAPAAARTVDTEMDIPSDINKLTSNTKKRIDRLGKKIAGMEDVDQARISEASGKEANRLIELLGAKDKARARLGKERALLFASKLMQRRVSGEQFMASMREEISHAGTRNAYPEMHSVELESYIQWLKAQELSYEFFTNTRPYLPSAWDYVDTAQTGQPFKGILFRGSGRKTVEEVYDPHFVQGPIFGRATYASPNREFAQEFGPQVDEIEISLANPLVISSDDEWLALTSEAGWFSNMPTGPEEISSLRRMITERGHDGVIIRVPSSEMTGKRLQRAFGDDTVVSFTPRTAQVTEGVASQVARVGDGPVRLTGTYDAFKRNNAPRESYVTSRGEDASRYTSDAYTSDYMIKSDDTGRLLRWVFELSDGRRVSIQGYLKATRPELSTKSISGKNALNRLWGQLSEDERKVLVDSVPWDEAVPGVRLIDNVPTITTPEGENIDAFRVLEKWLRDNRHPLADVGQAETYLSHGLRDHVRGIDRSRLPTQAGQIAGQVVSPVARVGDDTVEEVMQRSLKIGDTPEDIPSVTGTGADEVLEPVSRAVSGRRDPTAGFGEGIQPVESYTIEEMARESTLLNQVRRVFGKKTAQDPVTKGMEFSMIGDFMNFAERSPIESRDQVVKSVMRVVDAADKFAKSLRPLSVASNETVQAAVREARGLKTGEGLQSAYEAKQAGGSAMGAYSKTHAGSELADRKLNQVDYDKLKSGLGETVEEQNQVIGTLKAFLNNDLEYKVGPIGLEPGQTFRGAHYLPWENHNAYTAMLRLRDDGTIPTPYELGLLDKAFGEGFTEVLSSKRSNNIFDLFFDIANMPRANISSVDVSFLLRQGGMFSTSQVGDMQRAARLAVRMMVPGGDKLARSLYWAMQSADGGKAFHKFVNLGGIFLHRPGAIGRLAEREEAFLSGLAGRIFPWVRASERGYTTFLNKLRWDVMNKYVLRWESKLGRDLNATELRDLGTYINAMTGRGPMPDSLNMVAKLMNAFLFSQRLLTSRFAAPNYSARLAGFSPRGFYRAAVKGQGYERQAYKHMTRLVAQQMASWFAMGAGLVTLAANANKWFGAPIEAGTDPRSPDFGKIRMGTTQYDVWGGYSQIARAIGQLVSDEGVSTHTGQVRPGARNEVIHNFLRSKFNPSVAVLVEYNLTQYVGIKLGERPGKGTGFLGEDRDILHDMQNLSGFASLEEESFWTRVITPLFLRDLASAIAEEGRPFDIMTDADRIDPDQEQPSLIRSFLNLSGDPKKLAKVFGTGAAGALGVGVQTYTTKDDIANQLTQEQPGGPLDYLLLQPFEQDFVDNIQKRREREQGIERTQGFGVVLDDIEERRVRAMAALEHDARLYASWRVRSEYYKINEGARKEKGQAIRSEFGVDKDVRRMEDLRNQMNPARKIVQDLYDRLDGAKDQMGRDLNYEEYELILEDWQNARLTGKTPADYAALIMFTMNSHLKDIPESILERLSRNTRKMYAEARVLRKRYSTGDLENLFKWQQQMYTTQ